MPKFRTESCNWTAYRKLPNVLELDFHSSDYCSGKISPAQAMEHIRDELLQRLKSEYASGKFKFLLITHGFSGFSSGRRTTRSVIRRLMRSSDATPYIVRNKCIQHERVFVAAIRPLQSPVLKGGAPNRLQSPAYNPPTQMK